MKKNILIILTASLISTVFADLDALPRGLEHANKQGLLKILHHFCMHVPHPYQLLINHENP